MEYYFDQFSLFAHLFFGQIMQSLIPSLFLAIAVAGLLSLIKSIDAATRYRLWVAVLTIVIVLPVLTAFVPIDINLSGFYKGLIAAPSRSESAGVLLNQDPGAPDRAAKLNRNEKLNDPLVSSANPLPDSHSRAQAPSSMATTASVEHMALQDVHKNDYSYRQLILEGFPLIALMLWLLVFLVMLFRIVLGYRGLKWLKASALSLSEIQLERIERLTVALAIERRMEIRQSDRINIPVSAGFIRPMVIIPSGLIEKLDDRELQAIIVHEMAHLERYDDWMKLAQKLLTALLFFNPVVLWVGRRLDLERELACDSMVLGCTGQPRVYARCLTNMIQRNIVPVEPTLVTGAMLSRKQIFRRIDMILNNKLVSRPLSSGRFTGLIMSILILAILIFGAVPGLAWPYHPFKFSVIAEVVKEKTDSSTATVFRSGKNGKWQKVAPSRAPLIYLPDDEYLNQLDTTIMLNELKEALEAAELEALEERVAPPEPIVPNVNYEPAEPLAPEAVVPPKSERRFKKSGDSTIHAPVPDEADFFDSEEGKEYLKNLAKTGAKNAEQFDEALKKYYAHWKDKARSEADEEAAEEAYAEALERYEDEGEESEDILDDLSESVGHFINDLGNNNHTMINHADDGSITYIKQTGNGSITYEWKRDSDEVSIETKGEFRLNDDDNEIIWMADDALVEIYERKGGVRQELRIEPDDDGTPIYVYRYNGKTREFDSEARQWYHQIMADCVRKTGFNAAERVKRIYENKGLDGVLDEIDGIENNYVTRLYLGALIDDFELTDDELGRVIRFLTENMDSDYEKAELLVAIAAEQNNEKYLLEDFVLAAQSLESDYERRRVLSEVSLDGTVSTGVLLDVLEIAETMESDYERAQLLLQLSDLQRDDNEFRLALIRAIGAITSDYERSRIIQKMLQEGRSDTRIAADVLQLIADMSSDYEKSKLLIYLAGHSPRDQKLFDAYITVIGGMSSDYEVKKSLMALGPFYDLDDSTLLSVLYITEQISSDYERAQILKEMISEVNRGPHVRRALLQSVDDISSDYESSQILGEIVEQLNFDEDDAARDILVLVEQISSDYEKAKVISALIPSLRGRDGLEDDLADVIESISSDYERNKLYAELYRNTRGKR